MAENPLLIQARQSYHELATGTATVKFVDQNGESVQYNADKVSLDALKLYIRELEACEPGSNFRHRGGAIGFIF